MIRQATVFGIVLSVLIMSALMMGVAPDPAETLLKAGEAAATAGKTSEALSLFELAIELSFGKSAPVNGQAMGQYWSLVAAKNEFPRAFNFFGRLEALHPDSADVIASKASAQGATIGWLSSNGLIAALGDETIQSLSRSVKGSYDRALNIDPNNFSALFGLAIYESYTPDGAARSRQLFDRLNSLRAAHPEYPWAKVDQLQKQMTGK